MTRAQKIMVREMKLAADRFYRSEYIGGKVRFKDLCRHGNTKVINERAARNLFGNTNAAMRAADLFPTNPTRDDLLRIIELFIEKNGRAPGKTDVALGRLAYSMGTFDSRCGSLVAAIRELGYQPIGRQASALLTHRESLETAEPVLWFTPPPPSR